MKDRFIIADTFIDSMSSLNKGLKSSLWKCLSLLCKNHLHPSLNTEKLNGIFSSRITIDYRLIHEPIRDVFRLLFAGKHDDAYRFANHYKQQREHRARLSLRLEMPAKPASIPVSFKKRVEEPKIKAFFRKLFDKFHSQKIKDALVPDQIYSLKKLRKYFK